MQPRRESHFGHLADDTRQTEPGPRVSSHRYSLMNLRHGERVRIDQRRWTAAEGWPSEQCHGAIDSPQLVLCFAATSAFGEARSVSELRRLYPGADIVGCSTAGEICGT